jgi:hypothetical protein
MDRLEMLLLNRRLDLIESLLTRSGLVDAVMRGRSPIPIGDPSPDDPVRGGGIDWGSILGGGGWPPTRPDVDNPPFDLGRFDASQLQATLHQIAAARTRLDALEATVKQRLDKSNKPSS